jgi:hypothetical protein
MRFKNRENALMWERYVDPYSKLEMGGDDPSSDLTVEDPYNMEMEQPMEDESDMVVEFEPMTGLETEEQSYNEVVYSDVKKLAEYSKRLLDICKEKELEPWMQAKLVKASDYVSDIWHRLDAEADFANTGFEQSDNIEF